ncbi:MlaD family protein [Gemmata sp. JC717]|uniref:MlaD family protein n=1 Tax=Gemmata algarum TaxID=2975278 RepID=UPI0021BA4FC3|nr:MlaD family protein [Gemmata algarum]MDY3555422.1 MlaD family protein [Gemmata algarum]
MAERALRMRLGLFMGASLLALAGLVVLFGGTPRVFSSDVKYSVLFSEAPGIGPGTPIRKSGVRIGQVTGVELDPESGQVRVRVELDRKYLPRTSEEAHITRGLLSGDTAVDFLPKLGPDGQPVPRGEDWPPGSELPGVTPITPRSLVAPASNALQNAQQSLERMTKAFEKLERLSEVGPRIEATADEATALFKDVRAFIPELRKTNAKIQNILGPDGPVPPKGPPAPGAAPVGAELPVGFVTTQPPLVPEEPNLKTLIRDAQDALRTIKPAVDDVRATVKRLEPEVAAAVKGARTAFDNVNDVLSPENRKQFAELLKNLNSVALNVVKFAGALGTLLDSAEKTVKNIDDRVTEVGQVVADVRAVTRPLAARSEGLVKGVAESAEQLGKLIAEVRGIVTAFGKENGTVQKLISDPTVYQNLDLAAGSLARILARSEKITRDLEVFADKVARRPELIGVGGALRGSGGLKELPGTPSYRPDWPPASSARPFSGPAWLEPQNNGKPPAVQGYPP